MLALVDGLGEVLLFHLLGLLEVVSVSHLTLSEVFCFCCCVCLPGFILEPVLAVVVGTVAEVL